MDRIQENSRVTLPNARSLASRLRSLGFQSKLLIMLLTVSAVSVIVSGAIGYTSGTNSLRNAEYQRLTQLRESRQREMHNYFENISDAATVLILRDGDPGEPAVTLSPPRC